MTDLIPLLARTSTSNGGNQVPSDFVTAFVSLHDHDWNRAQEHWERIVERVLDTDAVDPALVVCEHGDWRVWVPEAASWPYELRVAPRHVVPDLVDPACDRDGLAAALVDGLARLDQLFDAPMPYMLWIHQRPTDGGDWPGARVHLHVTPLYRSPGVQRYVAGAELGGGLFFNPVQPVDAAAALRDLPGA
jgi:UDPglucose--hexose-1-phosphate uridylyltransferase